MVYCGKPSRGCQMCRTRRIKCDETKPTCNQCAKSRRQCPGYKDEFDLVFRNETQATERRARKASRKASVQKVDKQSLEEEAGTSTSLISPTSSSSFSSNSLKSPLEQAVIPSLNIPVEQRANYYFVSNFVLMPKPGCTRGFLDFLVPLLRQDNQASNLQSAFNACSLALLNNRAGSGGKLGEKALNEYSKALAGTNASLRDVEGQRADSTLAAVLLLGMFENITAKQIGLSAWGSHVEGAIQLVKIRGKKQLRTKTGLLLFIAVRTQMIIHTLSSAKSPAMGAQWWLEDAVSNHEAAQCQRVCIKVGELRGEVNRIMAILQRTPENIGLALDLIRRCQAVDQEAVAWIDALPDYWRHRTVAWEDHVPAGGDYSRAEVFPGRVDVYTDFYIASVWNMIRTSRLIIHSLIVRCAAWVCSPVDYRTTPEYAAAARTCVDIITDIIAAAPYFLGWHLKQRSQSSMDMMSTQNATTPPPSLGGFACGDEDATKALAGDFLTWPLVCISTQDYTTDAQRAWAQGRLKYIGNELGIKYAHVLTGIALRVPSMLIRRDAAMASPFGSTPNFANLISAAAAVSSSPSASASTCASISSSAGYTMMNSMHQQQQYKAAQYQQQQQKEYIVDRDYADINSRNDPLTRASSVSSSNSGQAMTEQQQQQQQYIAQKWLVV